MPKMDVDQEFKVGIGELFIALTEIAEIELVSRIRGLLENGYPKFCIIRSFWFRMPIRGVSVVLKHPVLK